MKRPTEETELLEYPKTWIGKVEYIAESQPFRPFACRFSSVQQINIALMDNNYNMLLFMNDKAHFHLNGCINNQNCHY